MNTQRIAIVMACAIMLGLASIGYAQAGGTAFKWSGWLVDGNVFLDGKYDLRFRLFDNEEGGNRLGNDVFVPTVTIAIGFFSGPLDFGVDIFDGQTRYVEIAYRLASLSDPYPYAVLAAPRQAVIRTHGLILAETVAIGTSYPEPVGLTVQGNVCVTRGNNLILKAAEYDAGDIIFRTIDGVQRARIWSSNHPDLHAFHISSDSDNDPELYIDNEGNVGIGTSNPGDKLDVAGNLRLQGAGNGIVFPDGTRQTTAASGGGGSSAGGFPRPAYDSGWVALAQHEAKTLYHNIGGNVDNYVVDMQHKRVSPDVIYGISNKGIGQDGTKGAIYQYLRANSISVYRGSEDYAAEYVRVRIWVYQ